jgi:secondary thiamine-phosphate synthase enzyme
VHELRVRTERRSQLVEITAGIRDAVAGARGTAVLVYIPHTTAAVTINERIDPVLLDDLDGVLERLAGDPGAYRHDDADGPNGASHLRASLVGPQVVVPLRDDGALALGAYQGVFLCEFDGPRERSVYVSVLR